ncbi:MAG: ThiF family adenylyltransferase [Planctomycetia bacterium]|nr:ThiF family adenylyltransferase [Planctomycetia bacterium]
MSDDVGKKNEVERISIEDIPNENDRFHRFTLIGWWNQARLREAKVLVVGAGALGNEIIKNLALLGVGNLFIVDMDNIENSNLSRSVLYRAQDNGKPKAQVAAERAREIFSEMNVHYFVGNSVYDLGTGVYHWADIVLGGLDNREARLSINRNCWKVNKPWIDGAIEKIDGVARVFVPDGACYECTMSDTDWELLNKRRSCNLLTRAEMQGGKTPTTPTISSIIAGIQCQEAVKILHGLDTFAGKGLYFNGLSADSYLVEYPKKDSCYSHDTAEQIISLEKRSDETTLREILDIAREELGNDTLLELGREILTKFICPDCGEEEDCFMSLGKVKVEMAICPHCGKDREFETIFSFVGNESCLDKTLTDLGVPKFDIIWARGSRFVGFELAGDKPDLFYPENQPMKEGKET